MAKGTFIIAAENRIKEGLDAAQRDLSQFGAATEKIGSTIKNALTVTAIAAALKQLGKAAIDCFVEFGEGERRLNTLKIALDNNAISIQKATSLIDKMAQQSLASKDDIEGLVAELASLGKSDAEIDQITRAAVNLANVTGKDLNSAFTLINATYSGTTGRLAQLLPEVKNLTTEQLAAGEATKLINDKFSELSAQLAANDIPQKLKSITDNWGDLKETIGAKVAPLFNPMLNGINSIITAWNSASRAAEAHRQLLGASGWTQKIALNQEIIDANRLRLDDIQRKQSAFGKSVGWNQAELNKSPSYQAWLAEASEIIAQNIAAQKQIDYYTEQLKKTPVSLLNPIDKVALLGEDGSTGSSTSKETKDPWAEWNPITSGPLSARGYSFGRQEWNQFGGGASIDESKFSPITSGPMSAAGYAFDKEYWNQFGDLPKYTEEQLQTMFAPVTSGMYSAAGYKLDKEQWEQFGKLPADTNKALDENFSPILTGMYSAAGYKFDKAFWDEFKDLPKYTNEQLDSMFAPVASGMYSAAGYKTDRSLWQEFSGLPRYTNEQLDDMFKPVADGMYSAAGYKLAKQEWDEFGDLPKITNEELDKNFAPIKEGMYSAAGYKLAKAEWDEFGGLPKYTSDQLDEMFAPVKTGMYSAAGYKLDRAFWDEFGNLPKYTAEKLQEMFEPVRTGMYSAAGYRLGKQEWEQFGKPETFTPGISAIDADSADAISAQVTFPELTIGADAVVDAFIGLDDTIATISSGMGDFGTSMLGPISELMSALGPFGNMIAGMNPLLAILLPIIEGFTAVLAPVIQSVLAPLMDALMQVGVILGQMLLPIFDVLAPIIALLANILITNLTPILQILTPIFQVIAAILQPFIGVVQLLAKVFTILMSPVQYIADLFSWLGGVLQTFAWNVQHPFKSKEYSAFSSDAFSGLQDRLNAIDAMAVNNQTFQNSAMPVSSYGSSAATASQSASYRTQSITINIYQNSPVVGSGGMDEFVGMIRNKFGELAYFGATA